MYDRIMSTVPAPGVPRNRTLVRAVELFRAVAELPEGGSTTELARLTSTPRATVTRTLATFADAGLVTRLAGSDRWTLGYDVARLARRADPYRALAVRAEPILEALAFDTGESAMLGVPLHPPALEVIRQVAAPQLVAISNWVSRDFPLYPTAFGKLVLAGLEQLELDAYLAEYKLERLTPQTIVDRYALEAELERVRRIGYAEAVDELEEGLSGVAVPLRDPSGVLIAVVGLGGPSFRLTRERLEAVRPRVQEAAADLGRAIG